MCELCQSKLEFCRQYFEQIYNSHVKLLGLLRDQEEQPELSFEEDMASFIRSYGEPVVNQSRMGVKDQVGQQLKCEPEIEISEEDEEKLKRYPSDAAEESGKHFLDDLLEEYENLDDSIGCKVKKPAARKLLVPPPLKFCALCGVKSSSHSDNLQHWSEVHPDCQAYQQWMEWIFEFLKL